MFLAVLQRSGVRRDAARRRWPCSGPRAKTVANVPAQGSDPGVVLALPYWHDGFITARFFFLGIYANNGPFLTDTSILSSLPDARIVFQRHCWQAGMRATKLPGGQCRVPYGRAPASEELCAHSLFSGVRPSPRSICCGVGWVLCPQEGGQVHQFRTIVLRSEELQSGGVICAWLRLFLQARAGCGHCVLLCSKIISSKQYYRSIAPADASGSNGAAFVENRAGGPCPSVAVLLPHNALNL